jgi:hypothetical protein
MEKTHTRLSQSDTCFSSLSFGGQIPAHGILRLDTGVDIVRIEDRFFVQEADKEIGVADGYPWRNGHHVVMGYMRKHNDSRPERRLYSEHYQGDANLGTRARLRGGRAGWIIGGHKLRHRLL